MQTKSLKSVLLIGNFASGWAGSRTVAEDLAPRLRAAGWRIFTASPLRARVARLADMLATITRHRNEYRVAHVDFYANPGSFVWAEACTHLLHALRKPYVVTVHGNDTPSFVRQHPDRVGWVLIHAAAVTAPSKFMASVVRPYGRPAVVIPNAIDIAQYDYRHRTSCSPRLVWCRRIIHAANPALAIYAAAELREQFPNVSLTLIGGDPGDGTTAEVRRALERTGMSERVALTGAVPKPEVGSHLARGDVFLNTSCLDNTPVTVLEAWASGLPVVSTYVGGTPHLITHERTGLLVPSDDPDSMAAAIGRVLTESDLAARLSVIGREQAETFDWSRILPRWEDLLSSVAR